MHFCLLNIIIHFIPFLLLQVKYQKYYCSKLSYLIHNSKSSIDRCLNDIVYGKHAYRSRHYNSLITLTIFCKSHKGRNKLFHFSKITVLITLFINAYFLVSFISSLKIYNTFLHTFMSNLAKTNKFWKIENYFVNESSNLWPFVMKKSIKTLVGKNWNISLNMCWRTF